MNIKYKKCNGSEYLHTLNASALALPRIVSALLENNYFDSKISIPEVLLSYTGFKYID
jgi:seryl-tRNA synthetase|tara:strand:- start:93 stop:266 length:174 start_codon:yes stop_codon:yes gene_type:complete